VIRNPDSKRSLLLSRSTKGTGDDSNGSVSVFEVLVPAGQKLAAPAHNGGAADRNSVGSERG